MTDFKWRHFQGDVILWAVRWYCRYPISYRDLEEMLASYDCEEGRDALASLYKVYFKRHGMQVQANMLDPKILIEARDNPELHPNLLIRVSGYSAYFNDLSPEMQDEYCRHN
jgi:pyruvate-formate lyase